MPGNLENLLESVFFLIYRGKYDGTFVYSLTTSERIWHVKRLHKQLEDEQKAREKRAAEAEAKSKAAAAKAKRKK